MRRCIEEASGHRQIDEQATSDANATTHVVNQTPRTSIDEGQSRKIVSVFERLTNGGRAMSYVRALAPETWFALA